MDNLTKWKLKTEPEWSVERCLCHVGQFRTDCPYATPEEETEVDSRKISSNLPQS